jgi:hypothetical protein
MVIFKGLRKYSAAVCLVMFFASVSLAAANGPSLPYDTIAQTIRPTNESSIKTSLGMNSRCYTGYFTHPRSVIVDLEHGDMTLESNNDCFKETPAIALHKDGDKIIWSLAPSFSKFSFNPIDDIKNLQVMLQYSFWF